MEKKIFAVCFEVDPQKLKEVYRGNIPVENEPNITAMFAEELGWLAESGITLVGEIQEICLDCLAFLD